MLFRRRGTSASKKGSRWTGTVPYFAQLRQDMFQNPLRYRKQKKKR
jgi:hypothetical protein